MTMKVRDVAPNASNSSNFNVVADSQTKVGTTLENLKSAVNGETGASAKYAAFSKAAQAAGYDQIARQFAATSAAEQIHIKLEVAEIQKKEPDYVAPEAPTDVVGTKTDLDLISGALGEIYETSDMYPSFINVAIEEGETGAQMVFTRAKLAESVHAELYMDAYNNIDAQDDEKFYLCPVCGYIHKGEDFEKCPICFAPKNSFREF
ncbi:nigerythrin [Adlercreutzia sp. ZJ154]|uniref:nigerythrin n=1 Tax=Adlercreutzia sp. ZJ154 TaxID=2709790 RepID=UPI001F14D36F|nr:rubrerythrin family protein [Adlercreutzia sp. ZJ154]